MEWIDPRYVELVAAWEASQVPSSRNPEHPRPTRAFMVPLVDPSAPAGEVPSA